MLAAVSEAATGAALLIMPTLVGRLLLGTEFSGALIVLARVTGIALVALGVACWPNRINPFRGMLTYNILMVVYLAWIAIQGEWVGPLLWIVVVLHVLMTMLLVAAWFKGQKTFGQE